MSVIRSKQSGRSRALRLIGFVLASLFLGITFAVYAPVRANNPVQTCSNTAGPAASTITCSLSSAVTNGDVIAIMIGNFNGYSAHTVTDSISTSYAQQTSDGGHGVGEYEIWTTKTTGGASDTITVTYTSGTSSITIWGFEYQASSATANGAGTGTGTGTASSVGSFSPAAGSVVMAEVGFAAGSGSVTPTSGWTATSPATLAMPLQTVGGEYITPYGGGATTAGMTISSSVLWDEVAISLPGGPNQFTRSPSASISLTAGVGKSVTLHASTSLGLSAKISALCSAGGCFPASKSFALLIVLAIVVFFVGVAAWKRKRLS